MGNNGGGGKKKHNKLEIHASRSRRTPMQQTRWDRLNTQPTGGRATRWSVYPLRASGKAAAMPKLGQFPDRDNQIRWSVSHTHWSRNKYKRPIN